MHRSSRGRSPSRARWTGARKMSPVRSLVAAAASPAIPRPSRGNDCCMCGRTGALSVNVTRCLGRSRMNASTSATTTTITHQYSRIRSILLSPIPLCVVATAKLAQIGEQKPYKKAQDGDQAALDDQRRAAPGRGPARARDSRHLADQPDELAALEIVGGAREEHSASQ